MPEFQASHFFILKILQCRIFTAVLIGIANLFRNYLFKMFFVCFRWSEYSRQTEAATVSFANGPIRFAKCKTPGLALQQSPEFS